ncbi:unnamed protein product [Rotaria sordida]|uniref:Uncharacterized protein n=1 Tax=Rotaria sordida TaxID=392033 RepID=A0A814HFY5_9BILA|nr:unnamed protein product [Rotaria sordida]CAF1009645.1 unnamed protein product [Rotaria sordida]CAF3892151.1 unnamed protein product [Rotaria sordida]CAF4053029.1 unnamed protein product [Rotaria sordida]
MATGNNDIDRRLGVPITNEKLCIIRYTGRTFNATVIATGCLTTLEALQEEFPDDNIQTCQENNIEYYRTISQEGPKFFVYQRDESKDKAYYWDYGHWHGYKTLTSVDFPTVHTTNDDDNVPITPQPPADDRRH